MTRAPVLKGTAVALAAGLVALASATTTCHGAGRADPTGPSTVISDLALVSAMPSQGPGDDIVEARLGISQDGRELRLDGELSEGVADRVAILLQAHPGVTRIRLRSDGGLVEEGLGIGALVAAYGLSTYVTEDCSSACTLAFVRGRERLLGPRGHLGFHGPYLVGAKGIAKPADASQERATYVNAGLAAEFVARALSGGPDTMWYPDPVRLRGAGVVSAGFHEAPADASPDARDLVALGPNPPGRP